MMLNAIQLASRQAGLSAADVSRTFQIPLHTVQSWEKGEKRPPAWVESKITNYVAQLEKERRSRTATPFAQGRGQMPGSGFARAGGFAQGGLRQNSFSRPAGFPPLKGGSR